MKSDPFYNLIKKGVKNPSPEFKDQLMLQIQLMTERKKRLKKYVILLFAFTLIICVASIFISLPQVTLYEMQFQLNYAAIAAALLFLVFELNQLNETNQMLKYLKSI